MTDHNTFDEPSIQSAQPGAPTQPAAAAPGPRPGHRPGSPPVQPGQPAPVDPAALTDYNGNQSFHAAVAEGAPVPAEELDGPPRLSVVLPINGKDEIFTLQEITRDSIALLQALSTLADNDAERAGAVFESMLGPAEYKRLQRLIRPALRDVAARHAADPENNPSIADVWVSMAEAITKPLTELADDPKRRDSLLGS